MVTTPLAELQIRAGPALVRVDLAEGVYLVGRRPGASAGTTGVSVSHASVSRAHAYLKVAREEGRTVVQVRDAGSKNGTSVVGVGVVATEGWTVLEAEGKVIFGECEGVVVLREASCGLLETGGEQPLLDEAASAKATTSKPRTRAILVGTAIALTVLGLGASAAEFLL
eukprot:CAMPEP_0204318676 /NCGR_PEP_ID=MMETSP0469-20131031/6670_1 /ASSEMBLY_ACC=CAM_ASM_000384 /TAXON_ID=2969 /ORGANISM="Oxyrrhis marina" /LENGTH=168 /DNA_ID=CAMNT_0051299759 /DNA_START=35 /DNA_END=541 /DNA_ORIENTATION=+